MLRQFLLFFILSSFLLVSNAFANTKPTLIFYCGITMVKPMQELASKFEKTHNCKIKIIQGGSQDLYDSLKLSQEGDLYLPGSDSYLNKNKQSGFFREKLFVGYNQVAIFVKKGNPKGIKDLEDFVNEEYASAICNPRSGSIGKMSKKVFIKYKGEEFFNQVFDLAIEISTDSRSLNASIKKQLVDFTLNWKATAFFDENKDFIDIIEVDEKYAPKKKLVLTVLSFSKNRDLTLKFQDYVASQEGIETMKKYGFR